jgi:hypothetical protein
MSRDEFEAKYMTDGSRVLHRDKRVSRGMAAILAAPGLFTLALAIFIGMANSTSDKPLPESALPFVVGGMALFSVLYFALAITFAVLRFVVTEHAVHVKYGLWGPTIPLESIESCRVVDYEWTKYGGWGIRRGIDGSWAYVASSGPVVEVVYREGKKQKKALLGAADAASLSASITRARDALASAGVAEASRARIAGGLEQEEVEPSEVEATSEQAKRAR